MFLKLKDRWIKVAHNIHFKNCDIQTNKSVWQQRHMKPHSTNQTWVLQHNNSWPFLFFFHSNEPCSLWHFTLCHCHLAKATIETLANLWQTSLKQLYQSDFCVSSVLFRLSANDHKTTNKNQNKTNNLKKKRSIVHAKDWPWITLPWCIPHNPNGDTPTMQLNPSLIAAMLD